MVYRIIYSDIIIIQYKIIDFFEEPVLEIIDLKTKEGRKRYKEIFGKSVKKQKKKILTYNKSKFIEISSFTIEKRDIDYLIQQCEERTRRLLGGFIAKCINKDGPSYSAILTGLSEKTIRKGIKEIEFQSKISKKRVRYEGGGRKTKEEEYIEFSSEIDRIIDNDLAGDPMTNNRWLRKTLRNIKESLGSVNIKSSYNTIRKNLKKKKISLKSNIKSVSFKSHPDRNLQFEIIKQKRIDALDNDVPLISIDTKKKEKIGNFKNEGRTFQKDAYNTLDHDFPSYAEGKLIPFGIYDIFQNYGYIYCGTTFETAEFAVDALIMWWKDYGVKNYLDTKEIYIICDGGGANGSRVRTWKYYLQTRFVDRFGVTVSVSHFPPYASKWNPIEHCLFSFISINWAGEPLTSYEKALGFINSTKTEKGLQVKAHLLDKLYEKGQKLTDEQMDSINLVRDKNFPQWNYSILPRKTETKI